MGKLIETKSAYDATGLTREELKELCDIQAPSITNVPENLKWYVEQRGYVYFASLEIYMLKGDLFELI